MTPYRFHPEAAAEYFAAIQYYEERQPGLGSRFTVEVEAAIDRLRESPLSYQLLEQDVRRCLTHVFPYALLYSIEADSILILAVMHCSQRPGYWKTRRDH